MRCLPAGIRPVPRVSDNQFKYIAVRILKRFFIAALLCAGGLHAGAQIKLPGVIGSNMILQRDKPVSIWGWARPEAGVSLTFDKQQLSVKADGSGYWRAILKPLSASFSPKEMLIKSDTSELRLSNILVGEVWLCSGQSNMEYTMKLRSNYAGPKIGVDSAAAELGKHRPEIRLLYVEKKVGQPDIVSEGWSESKGELLGKTAALAYFFAKDLSASLKVPVGVISSSWGGSRIEPWTAAENYKKIPAFRAESSMDTLKIDGVIPGKNYRSMILPLAPFAIRGVLWYQGESNCMIEEHDMRYAYKQQALVENWREIFEDKKMPFYYVLIAPHTYTRRKDKMKHTAESLPLFWEQQTEAARIPNTGFITVSDLVDDVTDIHPSYKWEVGRRLAALALTKTYGQPRPYIGPQYSGMKISGDKLILNFKNAAGLRTRDGKAPDWFLISGADGKFVPAKAMISGERVILSAAELKAPRQARFAWEETAMPNLENAAGLPAVPFRTDGQKWAYK